MLTTAMLDALILAGLVVAGYLGASGWMVPAGAIALTVGGWWRKVQLLRRQPQVPFSTKMTTYLVVSIGINLGLSAASLVLGRAARYLFGG
jgi:hypothetical protein